MRLEESSTLEKTDILHHVLTVEDPKGFRNFLLQNTTYSLGRGLDNLIVLRSNLVSRKHATLLAIAEPVENSRFFRIIDGNLDGVRSTNGVLVNGKKRFSHILSHGDELRFSKDTKAVYQVITSILNNPQGKISKNTISSDTLLIVNGHQLDFITSGNCSPLLAISDDDVSANVRDTINQFLSSPELNPQPVIDLNLIGQILYFNPATLRQFPDVEDIQTGHPLLKNLLSELTPLLTPTRNFFVREIEFNGKVFEEVVHFMPWNEVVRIHILKRSPLSRQKSIKVKIKSCIDKRQAK